MASREVTLVGGPFDGRKVTTSTGAPINAEGTGVPEGYAAHYRPAPGNTYTFEGLTKILLRIPMGGPSGG